MLLVGVAPEHELIFRLGGAQLVKVELVLVGFGRKFTSVWLVVARVVEAFVFAPRNSAELGIYNGVANLSLGLGI